MTNDCPCPDKTGPGHNTGEILYIGRSGGSGEIGTAPCLHRAIADAASMEYHSLEWPWKIDAIYSTDGEIPEAEWRPAYAARISQLSRAQQQEYAEINASPSYKIHFHHGDGPTWTLGPMRDAAGRHAELERFGFDVRVEEIPKFSVGSPTLTRSAAGEG